MLNDMRRKLGRKLQQVAAPRLESALVQYPYRSAARDPSAAILAQPLALDADRSIADVKELAVSAAHFVQLHWFPYHLQSVKGLCSASVDQVPR